MGGNIFKCLQGDLKLQDSPGDSSIAILLFDPNPPWLSLTVFLDTIPDKTLVYESHPLCATR